MGHGRLASHGRRAPACALAHFLVAVVVAGPLLKRLKEKKPVAEGIN